MVSLNEGLKPSYRGTPQQFILPLLISRDNGLLMCKVILSIAVLFFGFFSVLLCLVSEFHLCSF